MISAQAAGPTPELGLALVVRALMDVSASENRLCCLAIIPDPEPHRVLCGPRAQAHETDSVESEASCV